VTSNPDERRGKTDCLKEEGEGTGGARLGGRGGFSEKVIKELLVEKG